MCITAWCSPSESEFSFILAFNRDEEIERPTLNSHIWRLKKEDGTLSCRILSGIDGKTLKKTGSSVEGIPVYETAGSWLGVNELGRISFLNNISTHRKQVFKTRGQLVTNFLAGSFSIDEYIEQIITELNDLDGFNLLLGELTSQPPVLKVLSYHPNEKEDNIYKVTDVSGCPLSVMSNIPFGSELPKTSHLREKFQKAFFQGLASSSELELNQTILSIMASNGSCPITCYEDVSCHVFIKKLNKGTELEPDWYGTRATYILLVSTSTLKLLEFSWVHDNPEPSPKLVSNIEVPHKFKASI